FEQIFTIFGVPAMNGKDVIRRKAVGYDGDVDTSLSCIRQSFGASFCWDEIRRDQHERVLNTF
ncbi:hypothetical protein OFN60_43285, partial [Escherichia coli]|nr:hypothetical protein [Escherichia coli]